MHFETQFSMMLFLAIVLSLCTILLVKYYKSIYNYFFADQGAMTGTPSIENIHTPNDSILHNNINIGNNTVKEVVANIADDHGTNVYSGMLMIFIYR